MNGWGTTFLTIAPDGVALPCHSARELPDLNCPNVNDYSRLHFIFIQKGGNMFEQNIP
jgi:pyrroloquinoline quinone biosynthesis protein E